MSLFEIRPNSVNVYEDDQALPPSTWAKIIGCDPYTFLTAAKRAHAPIHTNHRGKEIYVRDFPDVVPGFTRHIKHSQIATRHQWAQEVNPQEDFMFQAPSGATIIFEHNHQK